jgi:hypothetical protein
MKSLHEMLNLNKGFESFTNEDADKAIEFLFKNLPQKCSSTLISYIVNTIVALSIYAASHERIFIEELGQRLYPTLYAIGKTKMKNSDKIHGVLFLFVFCLSLIFNVYFLVR